MTKPILTLVFWLFGCVSVFMQPSALARDPKGHDKTCLPTGVCLDEAGRTYDVGNMPLAMVLSPDKKKAVLSLSGWRQRGLQVVDIATGTVEQDIPLASAFLGVVFSSDGRTLYASAGNDDAIIIYDWKDDRATETGRILLSAKGPKDDGTRFPAGIALSEDGKRLYVAENIADSLAVIDLATRAVTQRLPVGPYPYATVSANGKVYVSAWAGETVQPFDEKPDGQLAPGAKVTVGHHPSALLLNAAGSRLFVACGGTNRVAVVDTKSGQLLDTLNDDPPSHNEGSTPNALALSSDGARLFVAEADNNAVAVFDLSKTLSDGGTRSARARLTGRVPVGWYPTGLLATTDSLLVINGKGRRTRPNPAFRQPGPGVKFLPTSPDYDLGQLNGTLTIMPAAFSNRDLAGYTRRVAHANNWDRPRGSGGYPPFRHVIYIIKENRTYDQVFGDLKIGDGDPSLNLFPRSVAPNHHALAERFGLFDRFFVNAEVSAQGHDWSTGAWVPDYAEKTTPSVYAAKRTTDDHDDAGDHPGGYIWNSALKKGLSFRNYGEFSYPVPNKDESAPTKYKGGDPTLDKYTDPDYPGFDNAISDQLRFTAWQREFESYVEHKTLPDLEIMYLPRDHTLGGRAGFTSPKSCFADNDLALGRVVETLSNSPYWKDTLVLVLEDDAQDGPDHVDSHRSVMLALSAYNKGGVIHRFVNTTDVFATMERILGLAPLSHFDEYGRPLTDIFNSKPDLRPYKAITPEQPLDTLNPPATKAAALSMGLDMSRPDVADMELFNRVLWSAIMGDGKAYPGSKRSTTLDVVRAR